jgi:thiamine pyrophosphate-dependent acetolactate synthase large subunit-like protein
MSKRVADPPVETLQAAGVTTCFGVAAGTVIPRSQPGHRAPGS